MDIKHIKLYHFPATRSARVRWALHETVGDGFEVETLQLYEGAQYSENYLQKNPNHNVPLLEITDAGGGVFRMIESAAMVEWLVDAFPDRGLSPPAHEWSLARADYLQMLHFGSSWMDMMLWQIRVHEHILPQEQVDTRTIDRYRTKFRQEVEPQLLARLNETPYICGEAFSGADIIIGHNVTWARGYGMCQDECFRAYLSKVSKRPAFARAFADAARFDPAVPDRDKQRNFSG